MLQNSHIACMLASNQGRSTPVRLEHEVPVDEPAGHALRSHIATLNATNSPRTRHTQQRSVGWQTCKYTALHAGSMSRTLEYSQQQNQTQALSSIR